jgi:hypothetical protein
LPRSIPAASGIRYCIEVKAAAVYSLEASRVSQASPVFGTTDPILLRFASKDDFQGNMFLQTVSDDGGKTQAAKDSGRAKASSWGIMSTSVLPDRVDNQDFR